MTLNLKQIWFKNTKLEKHVENYLQNIVCVLHYLFPIVGFEPKHKVKFLGSYLYWLCLLWLYPCVLLTYCCEHVENTLLIKTNNWVCQRTHTHIGTPTRTHNIGLVISSLYGHIIIIINLFILFSWIRRLLIRLCCVLSFITGC